jgi:hypothetical protein
VVERVHRAIVWQWLHSRGAVLADPEDPGESQNAVLARFGLAAVARKRDLTAFEAFSIEAPDHCLGRLLQRAPGIDLGAVLMEAQRAFFAADAEVVARHADQGSNLYLECGPGLLLCGASWASWGLTPARTIAAKMAS